MAPKSTPDSLCKFAPGGWLGPLLSPRLREAQLGVTEEAGRAASPSSPWAKQQALGLLDWYGRDASGPGPLPAIADVRKARRERHATSGKGPQTSLSGRH